MSISRDEWLKAVDDAEREARTVPESDALSMKEFAEMLGVHRLTATARMDQLIKMGRAEKTTKKIVRLSGLPITVTAYRLLP